MRIGTDLLSKGSTPLSASQGGEAGIIVIFIIFSGNIFIHYVKNAEDLCQSSDDGFDEGMDTSDNENQDASKSQPLAQYRNAIYKIGMCIVMLLPGDFSSSLQN